MYREWFPQIMYNHHQAGPAGTVLFCPPFRDPFNYNCDPLVINGIDSVGAAMIQRFLVEGKPGATIRSGAPYSTWFNGGLRTTASFHNMIGLLTETIGSPTPMQIPLVAAKQLPKGDYLAPIAPAAVALPPVGRVLGDGQPGGPRLRLAEPRAAPVQHLADGPQRDRARQPRQLDDHPQGRRGRRPGRDAGPGRRGRRGRPRGGGRRGRRRRRPTSSGSSTTRPAATRGATSSRRTSPTSSRRRSSSTPCSGPASGSTGPRPSSRSPARSIPAGSYVVKSAQAFRAHVLDMFEPQDHPNDFAYPGGPPIRPYDSAGYTLAFQMAVSFDRVLDGFDGPFEEIEGRSCPRRPAGSATPRAPSGFFLGPQSNDAFRAVNRLLKAGEEVSPPPDAVPRRGRRATRRARSSSRSRPTTLAAAGEDRRRARHAVPGQPAAPGAGGRGAQAGPRRPVGPLRRVDALGLDPLAAGAVRVPVPGRVRAGAGQGRPAREVRRADPGRRRDRRPGAGRRAVDRGGERPEEVRRRRPANERPSAGP